jgi:cytochrome c
MKLALRAAAAAAALCVAGGVHAQSGEELLKKNGCTACHATDKKIVGPAYVDVAAKYKGEPKAKAYLIDKVKKGGSGVWGPVPMPPNSPQVSDADIAKDVEYILSLKK